MMSDPFRLDGQRALVVGAAGGVGAATCRLLARLGASVAAADLAAPTELASELQASGAAATAHFCDVTNRPAVEALVATCAPLDVIVYTAAICPFDDWERDDWDDAYAAVLSVNLKGALDVARAGLAVMKGSGKGRGGRIILVSSLAGRTGGLIASPHYVASKGGLNALVKWLAQRGAPHDVLVNGVAPASIDTPMMAGQPVDTAKIPLGRMARPDEVAGPIAFLAAPASSYMTGVILDVNGGLFAP